MRILNDNDLVGKPLAGKTVAVLGYGNQGEAHALNLRDSGVRVVVGLRAESLSRPKAEAEGLAVVAPEEACVGADVVALMVPDEAMPTFVPTVVVPNVRPGAALLFAHGFPIRFGGLEPPEGLDVVMVAPMGPGLRLRELYLEGSGLPAAVAVEQDVTKRARHAALMYAKALGSGRVGIFETTFSDETEIDLFSEQAVLTGGVTRLIQAGYDTLVEAGYEPALAYMECLYELELTVNLIRRYGIRGMRERISRTALLGDLTRGDLVIGPESREGMRTILAQVRDGTFARELLEDERAGGERLRRLVEEAEALPIEEEGKRLASVAHGERGGGRPAGGSGDGPAGGAEGAPAGGSAGPPDLDDSESP
jgi:ketol-acid reductoisomerase